MVNFGIHLFVHVELMYAWAHGNVMLLWSTIWFTFLSLWNVALLLKLPELFTLPRWTRVAPFVFSSAHLAFVLVGLGGEILDWFSGDTWKDTVEEIVFMYVLWLNTPTAIIESSYVYQELFKTNDIRTKK